MRIAIGLCVLALLAACVATQEEPPSKQAEAYVKQLGQKLRPGTPMQAAIAEVENQGFKCREAAARPMPMGHTVICAHATPQAWGVVLVGDNDAKLTAVRSYERTASRH
jgi:hypothetical protein